MLNPFKYRPVSQNDDEDEDIFYQGKDIPLTNLGKAINFDDEVQLEMPRKQPTARRRGSFAFCLVIAISIIFVALLITLLFYIANPLKYFNGYKTNSTLDSAIVAPSAVHHIATQSTASSIAVIVSKSSLPSILPTSTITAYEATSTTDSKGQSTTSIISGVVVTEALPAKISVVKQASESAVSSSMVTSAVMPALTTTTVSNILSDSTLIAGPTNPNSSSTEISSSLIEPSLTTSSVVDSSGTVYPSATDNLQSTSKSTISIPTATSIPTAQNNTIHWHKMNLDATSETTPVVIDVNGDGIDDIIYTHASYTKALDMYYCTSSAYYENACMEDTGHPVCGSVVVAVSGLNGEIIWLRNLTRPVFGIRCIMDVDEDNEIDCFVIGRYHQWDAINKATGETIWEADASIGFPGYNFYFPLPLEDFDGDGIVDILNIHGGDQSYGSHETNRSSALIVILSGRTGKKLIDPITVPDGRESYMSPVRYTFANEDVIMFGTGGETINGSLWAITVKSIKEFVSSKPMISTQNYAGIGCHDDFINDMDRFRPKYDKTAYQLNNQDQKPLANCPPLGPHLPIINKYKLCLYEIYSSDNKGLIIPPVIIDMNNDDVQDLIVQSFNGHVMCINGVNSEVLWERYIPNSESYNVPAPLFYNDDDTPDIFLRVNIGEWDDYEYSYVVIIDGTDGTALWAMNSSYATMQSAVTLMSVNHSQDAVVFFAYNPIDTKDLNDATVKKRQEDNSLPEENIEEQLHLENTTVEEDYNVEGAEHLGEQFWNLSNASFPDPLVDPEGFIESCKLSSDQGTAEQQSYLYLITRDVVTKNHVDPIAAAFPGILIPGYGMIFTHKTKKRHGSFQPPSEIIDYIRNNAWRCSYVQSPSTYAPNTPVLADLNHDGKLELIYAFQFASDNNFFAVSLVHTVFDLHVQTIENMVEPDVIDFSKFLPLESQSWTTYMGAKGDGMYNLHR